MSDSKTIPEGWVEAILGEVVGIQPGFAFKSHDFDTKKGFSVIKIKNIQPPIIKIESDDLVEINSYSRERLAKFEVRGGEYLIAMTGETIGKVGKYNLGGFAYINQRVCKIVKTSKSDYRFIYYALLKDSFQKFINTHSFGAAQANISTDQIGVYKIILPPLLEQQAIAQMLSSFDDKIELLREQNETLEKTAQTIFQEWFGKYGVEDDLPEGWRVGKVKDFVDILSGFAFKSDDFSDNGKFRLITIANVQDGSFVENTKDGLVEIPGKMPDYCHLKTGDILLSLTGNVGRICHVIGMNYLLNQRVAKLKAKNKNDFGFVYLFFRQPSLLTTLINISVGTAQQNLSPIKTAEIEAILPDDNTMKLIGENINPMIEKILSNLLQIQSLSRTRDTLLPRLMSGEVRL